MALSKLGLYGGPAINFGDLGSHFNLMASTYITFQDLCDQLLQPNVEVAIILTDGWAAFTVSGKPVVFGTIVTVDDPPDEVTVGGPCCAKRIVPCKEGNCYYQIDIDLDQFILQEGGLPYEPTVEDIKEVTPYVDTVKTMLGLIG